MRMVLVTPLIKLKRGYGAKKKRKTSFFYELSEDLVAIDKSSFKNYLKTDNDIE